MISYPLNQKGSRSMEETLLRIADTLEFAKARLIAAAIEESEEE